MRINRAGSNATPLTIENGCLHRRLARFWETILHQNTVALPEFPETSPIVALPARRFLFAARLVLTSKCLLHFNLQGRVQFTFPLRRAIRLDHGIDGENRLHR